MDWRYRWQSLFSHGECWFCKLKRWLRQLFLRYYCSRCDVVSPPTKTVMVYRGCYVGMRPTKACALCDSHDELHLCWDGRILQLQDSKANTERHRAEQEEYRRRKRERKRLNREKQERERAAKRQGE